MFAGRSLGWGVLRHGYEHLPSPADPEKPLVLTDEQAELVLRWYAVNDDGEFIHRRGAIEMAKGWGKSPLAAFLAIEELVGPVVFDHWRGEEPIGRSWDNPWVQIAAVSEDQTDNTYSAVYEMLVANDHRAAKSLGIDDGRTRLYVPRGRLEPVTAAAGSREGQRITFAVLDETHLWTRRNGGIRLAGTLRRNVAKMSGRTLETTNAPLLGEKSVAEQSGLDLGVMHYARRPAKEPDPNWSDDKLIASLDETYGDATWIDKRRLVAEIRDPATNWDDALRYYFNWRTAGAGRAVDPRRWDELARPEGWPPDGTYIGVGFDGSVSRDATVLEGCTADGRSFNIGKWQRPAGPDLRRWLDDHPGEIDWKVDRLDVDRRIEEMFARWRVGRMLVDPFYWQTEAETWAERHGGSKPESAIVLKLETNQARRFAPAVDRWLTAIREGSHTHDGDELVSEHVKAAHLQKVRIADDDDDGRTKYILVKGDDHGRIDGAVADVLAFEAAMTMPAEPPAPAKPDFF